MSDPKIQAIKDRWKAYEDEIQCEHWWYAAVRHIQRNVDLCLENECDCEDPKEPGRYDGPAYAHAVADIKYLLRKVSDDE